MKKMRILIFLLFAFNIVYGQNATIKFATLAPDGSTWMTIMKDFSSEIEKLTNGQVKFKIYPGGVQGDDKDVLRKMRINQLHSAGFTGVGLGEILPEVRILDSPFLFRNHEEVDYVSGKFFDRFAKGFEEKGYILLGWAEVGFVYIYTNKPVHDAGDLKGVKMWMWEGDPLAEATFKAFDVNAIPLSVTDVMTSLQTGLIDGVYISPLACVGFQWFTKVKYVLDVPLANSNGAVLISKKIFEKLSPEQQKIVRETGIKYFTELVRLSRRDNQKSIDEMLKYGIKREKIGDPEILSKFEEIGKKARRDLVGRLYDETLLNDVEAAVLEYRKSK
ncbi:MAG: TRAP transporter substrate-binding protein DctP [Calditrichaceae bacterium]